MRMQWVKKEDLKIKGLHPAYDKSYKGGLIKIYAGERMLSKFTFKRCLLKSIMLKYPYATSFVVTFDNN